MSQIASKSKFHDQILISSSPFISTLNSDFIKAFDKAFNIQAQIQVTGSGTQIIIEAKDQDSIDHAKEAVASPCNERRRLQCVPGKEKGL